MRSLKSNSSQPFEHRKIRISTVIVACAVGLVGVENQFRTFVEVPQPTSSATIRPIKAKIEKCHVYFKFQLSHNHHVTIKMIVETKCNVMHREKDKMKD